MTSGPMVSWKALVNGDGYLDAAQREAFEHAIAMVGECLRRTLDKPAARIHGRFNLATYVDSLETDFQRDAGDEQVNAAAALTAFWIVRVFAERLLDAAAKR